MSKLNKIWLAQEQHSSKGILRKRISTIPDLDCYVGLIGATGARMFQLEADQSTAIHSNYLRRFRGVEIQVIPFPDATKQSYTIILIENDLTDLFTLFIEDILDHMKPVSVIEDALTTVNLRVNYWKRLFGQISGETLSRERQRGLFGELFMLRLLLQKTTNTTRALQTWHGALSAPQDFAHDLHALEIKTSKAMRPVVYIANEQQLDSTSWDSLYLGLIMVNETSGCEHTLAVLIEEIQRLLKYDHSLVTTFQQKLTAAGISADALGDYQGINYSVRNYRFYHVRSGFPAITTEMLEYEELSEISYRLDLSTCTAFYVPEEEVIESLV